MYSEVIQCKDLKFRRLYSEQQVMKQISSMTSEINQSLTMKKEKDPDGKFLILGVLNGAFMFLSDIVKRIKIPILVDFIKCKSYDGQQSKELKILSQPDWHSVKDSHVLLVDDICDTGKTLTLLVKEMYKRGAKSVETAVLVKRPEKNHETKPTYCGLQCSDFIVGFGLDYSLHGRQYPEIYQKLEE